MKSWLRRIRGALGLGLSWGITGFLAGTVLELLHNLWPNPVGGAFDLWPMALAGPGLLAGRAFSVVLGIAGRRYRFDELSVPRVAAWGAIGGALVSLIPAAMVGLGLASANVPLLEITLGILLPFSVGGAVAAAGTLRLAQMSEDGSLLREGDRAAEVGLTEEERQELLGS